MGQICKEFNARLGDLVEEDVLPASERERLRKHARECPDCGKALESFRALLGHMRALPRVKPPPDLVARVLEKIGPSERSRTFLARKSLRHVTFRLAALVLVAVGAGVITHLALQNVGNPVPNDEAVEIAMAPTSTASSGPSPAVVPVGERTMVPGESDLLRPQLEAGGLSGRLASSVEPSGSPALPTSRVDDAVSLDVARDPAETLIGSASPIPEEVITLAVAEHELVSLLFLAKSYSLDGGFVRDEIDPLSGRRVVSFDVDGKDLPLLASNLGGSAPSPATGVAIRNGFRPGKAKEEETGIATLYRKKTDQRSRSLQKDAPAQDARGQASLMKEALTENAVMETRTAEKGTAEKGTAAMGGRKARAGGTTLSTSPTLPTDAFRRGELESEKRRRKKDQNTIRVIIYFETR